MLTNQQKTKANRAIKDLSKKLGLSDVNELVKYLHTIPVGNKITDSELAAAIHRPCNTSPLKRTRTPVTIKRDN